MAPSILYAALACLIAQVVVAVIRAPKARVVVHILPFVAQTRIEFIYIQDANSDAYSGIGRLQAGSSMVLLIAQPVSLTGGMVVGNPQLADELRKAPDDQLSAMNAIEELFQTPYTVGKEIMEDFFHVNTVRSALTRNIPKIFGDVLDEIENSFSVYVPSRGTEWVEISAYDTIMHIVCRVSNRVFVGLPICRNPDYQQLNETFTTELFTSSIVIASLPSLLKPLLAPLIANPERNMRRIIKHIGPIIEARIRWLNQKSPAWDKRPNDLISWLLEAAPESRRNVRDIAMRVLFLNFGAIHTTTITVAHVLYTLAVHPEYIQPLREEVEDVVNKDGWSKSSMAKLVKLDSVMKETLRQKITAIITERKVLKDFTFSDGTYLPAGCYVAIPSVSIHYNEELYPDPNSFDGFRFVKMQEADADAYPAKHATATLSPEWLPFGTGRHAWCEISSSPIVLPSYPLWYSPGRFFAVNEIKCLLAYILLNYDFKLAATERERPLDTIVGISVVPNQTAKLAFRKRTSPVS
ncbi:hypothetical protein AX16_000001 [Volvariella volvacea WC 439]|nr:hypothetical protein AX16_000001 [Volvariella volvacea WC 439]